MNLLDTLKRVNSVVEQRVLSLSELDRLMDRLYYGQISASGQFVTVANALTVPTVWGCVQAISQSIAANPCKLYKRNAAGGRTEIFDHRVASILESPNDEQTPLEFWETILTHRLLYGNAYGQIILDGYGPRQVWPLDPSLMRVVRNKATHALEYHYGQQQSPTIFQFGEILHLRGRSLDGVTGLSVIGQARETIGQSLAIQQYGASWFGHGSIPGGFLSTDKTLSLEGRKQLKVDWEDSHKGLDKAHRVAVLEGGLKWNQIQIPPEDAQFLGTSLATKEDICAWFGVPQHKVGLLGKSTRVTIEEQELEWVTDTLRPECERIEQVIQRDLINISDGKRGVYARFDLRNLLRGNLTAQGAWFVQGRQWGWLNVDEIREDIGLNPLPDGLGQIYIQPLNMAPAGENIPEPEDVEQPGVPNEPTDAPPDDVIALPAKGASANGHMKDLRELLTIASGEKRRYS